MSSEIDLASVVVKKQSLVCTEIDDALVFLDVNSGKYFSVEGVGKSIWEKVQEPASVQEICDSLVAEYDVSFEDCRDSVTGFVDQLLEKGILELG